MKTEKSKSHKSLIRICSLYFVLYSLAILVIYGLISYFISRQPIQAFPTLSDLLEYSDALENDHFSQIPLSKLKNCEFIIYDADYRPIYMTSQNIEETISKDDLDFISDFSSDTFYTIYDYYGHSGRQRYFVLENRLNQETGSLEINNFCILNSAYEIKNGELFVGRGSLTQREVDLIRGVYSNKKEIQKYQYTTVDGEDRTLIFISPKFNSEAYLAEYENMQRLWLIAIPAALLAIVGLAVLFARRIKAYMRPLDCAITEYGKGNRLCIEKKKLPAEFLSITDNFDRLTDQLEASKAEAKATYQERQRILADISHDLKTPLTVIQGYAKAMQDGMVPEEKKAQYLAAIYNKAVSLSNLTEALFEYTKVEHPEYTLSPEDTELTEFCKEYLADKYQEIELKGFTLAVDIPEETVCASIDRGLIRHLFDNLFGNALKYNPAGTALFFTLLAGKEEIGITVADNGVGISEGIRERAFLPFVTGNSARSTGTGTGLGMAISQRIVELHGGKIELVSPPHRGTGTEILITLPRRIQAIE